MLGTSNCELEGIIEDKCRGCLFNSFDIFVHNFDSGASFKSVAKELLGTLIVPVAEEVKSFGRNEQVTLDENVLFDGAVEPI